MSQEMNTMKYVDYLKAFLCAFGVLYLANQHLTLPIVVYVAVYCAFICLYKLCKDMRIPTFAQSKFAAAVFSLFIVLGEDWLGLLLDDYSKRRLAYTICACVGVFLLSRKLLDILFFALLNKKGITTDRGTLKRENATKVFLVSFLLLWCVYFCFFLNQYPGSLSCDTPGQLAQAMGDRPFENANPFINTIVLTFFVRLGLYFGDAANLGVAMYTFFQFTLTALVFAYTITLLYRIGVNRWIIVLSQLFFNIMPYNIVYANGMWKDTFFAVFFLATMVCFIEIIYIYIYMQGTRDHQKPKFRLFVLYFLTLIASLSRNSGWSSLLVLGIAMLLYSIKNKYRIVMPIARTVIMGTLSALIIISTVYPAFGVTDNGGIVTGLSVPLQQVSRVVSRDGEVSQETLEMINEVIPVEEIKNAYDPHISDPIKALAKEQPLKDNLADYAKLWISIGIKNPKIYLDAYLDLTKHYWHLDSSGWIWDERIFDNPYGVARESILFPNVDMAYAMAEIINFPKHEVFFGSSIVLWIAIIMCSFAGVRKNRLGRTIYIAIFAIYVGLMLTSPVALFRYTYSATVSLPLIVSLPFIDFGLSDAGQEEITENQSPNV